ncbi:MAG: GxxExxY protein [Lentisphaeria bacterium]|nr:GxxExxY protein [Lentisphaeria bacterium]
MRQGSGFTTNEHRSQVFHYLKATGIEHGLLINFGSYRFEIKKFLRTQALTPSPK